MINNVVVEMNCKLTCAFVAVVISRKQTVVAIQSIIEACRGFFFSFFLSQTVMVVVMVLATTEMCR